MPSPPPPLRPPLEVMVNDSEGWNRAWGGRNKQRKINSEVTETMLATELPPRRSRYPWIRPFAVIIFIDGRKLKTNRAIGLFVVSRDGFVLRTTWFAELVGAIKTARSKLGNLGNSGKPSGILTLAFFRDDPIILSRCCTRGAGTDSSFTRRSNRPRKLSGNVRRVDFVETTSDDLIESRLILFF